MRAGAAAAFVAISGNYYDDLLARFALEPAQVERMLRLGILYDRDSAGEYFHIYSRKPPPIASSSRSCNASGYDAYGALNAPARMAAQEQATERS